MGVWLLVDGENIVRNVVRWDGEETYDPSPLQLRPYVEHITIDEPYPTEPDGRLTDQT